MKDNPPATELAGAPPTAEEITAYDRAHFATYLSLLFAAGEGHSAEKMALDILSIDSEREPERAHRTLRSHLERANWLAKSGYKHLLNGDPPKDVSAA